MPSMLHYALALRPRHLVPAQRSLNSEAIACLENALVPGKITPAERLARARALRAPLGKSSFTANDIAAFKNEGRP